MGMEYGLRYGDVFYFHVLLLGPSFSRLAFYVFVCAVCAHRLLGSHTYSVRAFCFGSPHLPSVCLASDIEKLSEIGAKFPHLHRKSGSESKNMMSCT